MKEFPKIKTNTSELQLSNYFVKDNSIFGLKKPFLERKKNNNGYLYEIILFGLNYHAKRMKYQRRDFYLDLQKSHRILIDENLETPFRTRIFKRRLILFGYDKRSLLNVINLIKSKKPQNSYFGHGAILSGDKFKLKPGKIKQK